MVVVGRRDTALQGRDPDGQDPISTPPASAASQILVPLDTSGIKVEKMLPVFGFDDAPATAHAQCCWKTASKNSCSARPRLRDRAGPPWSGPDPSLHAHHRQAERRWRRW